MVKKNITLPLSVILSGFLINGCATLPTNFERQASYAFTDTDSTSFGKAYNRVKDVNPGKSGFLLLISGLDAFVARTLLAHYAERSIDVQYYLYHDDLIGRLFLDQLLKAANRGVRVRLLVDDMGMSGKDLGIMIADSHPNMEVRIFNPFSRKRTRLTQFVTRMGSVTRRMHNKSFTVDNQICILGGRNIGNEYFEAHPDLAFADLDVLAIGPVAGKVSTAFDLYWNSELAYPASVIIDKRPTPHNINQKRKELDAFVAEQADSAYMDALQNSSLAHKINESELEFYWGKAKVFYDKPEKLLHNTDKTKYFLAPKLEPYFKDVKEELIIFSPYFVPGKSGTALLTELAERGVKVRILTNSLASNDVGIVHSGYSKYRKKLLRSGIELYELNKKITREQRKEKKGTGGSSKASLHAKSFVFDRKELFIGSLNLDPRAVIHNTEIGAVFSSSDAAAWMSDWFEENIDMIAFKLELTEDNKLLWHGLVDGKPYTTDREPNTGFWRRFGTAFMRLFPIESQL